MALTTCLHTPGPARAIAQLLTIELATRGRRVAKRLGFGRPRPTPAVIAPDSALARQAEVLVRELSPAYLCNHCFRTHAFAVAIAAQQNLRYDAELLYVACLLHDLGLTEAYSDEGPFELRGARAARAFCIDHGLPESKADLVHEAIALHTSLSSAQAEPEIALVHFGAGADVIGYHLEDVEPSTVAQILEAWPRLNFKAKFAQELVRQLNRSDASPLALQWRLGFASRITQAPFTQ